MLRYSGAAVSKWSRPPEPQPAANIAARGAREALLGAVVDHRDAGQRQHRQQRLAQAGLAAAGQEAVDVVVVDEVGQPVRAARAAAGCV